MTVVDIRLEALVTHARDVPFAERESFSSSAREWSTRHGGFVLETCHRVEAYAVTGAASESAAPGLPAGGRRLRDEEVVRHAIAVATGRDSVALGEDQVLHQLREAVTAARRAGHLDPLLDRLFSAALRAGRQARSWRSGPARSLADLAVAEVERRSGSLRGRSLLVVGAGQMGALAVRAAVAAGALVAVTSRTAPRAEAVAARFGARALPLDPGPALVEFAGILVALRGPWRLSPDTTRHLQDSAAVIVDFSVPPALTDDLSARLGERLVSADALAVVGDDANVATRLASRLERLTDSAAVEFLAWLDGRDRRAAARALSDRANAEREAALSDLWRQLPELDVGTRAVIDTMTRHLTARLFRAPLDRLGEDADGRAERAVRELFGL